MRERVEKVSRKKLNSSKENRRPKKIKARKKSSLGNVIRVKAWNTGRFVRNVLNVEGQGKTDFWIGMTTFCLLLFGVLMAFSAAYYSEISKGNSPYTFLIKDMILAIGGLIAMVVISFVDYRIFKKYYVLIAIVTFILFLGLFTPLGKNINGATRWLNLGVFTLMPGEISKMATIFWIAGILSNSKNDANNLSTLAKIWALVGAYVALIMWQPNMSTAMTVIFIAVAMLFVAGLRMLYFGGAIGLVGVGVAGLVLFGDDYRIKRYTTFLDPFKDPTGDSWQVVQSLLALGSGGMLGKGPGGSVQKALYLPEAQTDFILAIIGEELGFWGICLMIAGFAFLVWRGLVVAMNAPDLFGMYVACGIVMMIGIQMLLNIAIVTSTMPATGVALPFISYGGNATIIYCAAIGILMNIARSKKDKEERDFI